MSLDKLFERNTHFVFNDTWLIHGIVRPTETIKPACAAPHDRRRDGNRLDIVNGRWCAIKSGIGREWWLQPWLALLTFKAFQESRFLSANISARPVVNEDIHIPAGIGGILAEQTGLITFVNSGL